MKFLKSYTGVKTILSVIIIAIGAGICKWYVSEAVAMFSFVVAWWIDAIVAFCKRGFKIS